MTKKEALIKKINEAFKNVTLGDGIGLWEAQGHDDRLTVSECRKLRAKDEKEDWIDIPLIHLYQCSSSLSFFDAKGMHFHLPILLLFAIGFFKKEEKKLLEKGLLKGCTEPHIEFHLMEILSNNESAKKYYKERYSLLTIEQLQCIRDFFEYKKNLLETYYKSNEARELGLLPAAVAYDTDYIQLQKAIVCWTDEFQIK
ncbi:DUF6714 family protein [uncultured Aquimarina sp.]|uniref:DUF6714 family protein n=1 Tax=uncultured Aquimarina sp. TaxID=575652 RepID=UPI00262C846D|nr:DUF6714 family protein [uncultured Aquimarina sp.]